MEGKVSLELFKLQSKSLACSPSRLSSGNWAKQFITRILHISHGQWIFCNTSLHHETQGYLRLQERTATLATIDHLSTIDPVNIPDKSKYLLEMEFSSLRNNSLEQQSFWVYAMKAAFSAGRRTPHRNTRTMTPMMCRRHQNLHSKVTERLQALMILAPADSRALRPFPLGINPVTTATSSQG